MKKNLDITNGIFFSQRVLLELTTVGFTEKSLIKLFKKMRCKLGKIILHFMIKLFQIKKLQTKYLLINLKSYLILVTIQKKLI